MLARLPPGVSDFWHRYRDRGVWFLALPKMCGRHPLPYAAGAGPRCGERALRPLRTCAHRQFSRLGVGRHIVNVVRGSTTPRQPQSLFPILKETGQPSGTSVGGILFRRPGRSPGLGPTYWSAQPRQAAKETVAAPAGSVRCQRERANQGLPRRIVFQQLWTRADFSFFPSTSLRALCIPGVRIVLLQSMCRVSNKFRG